MVARSNDGVLLKARELCLDAGVDPDQSGEDGKPAWLSFVDDARMGLKIDVQYQDPVAFLRAIEKPDPVGEVTTLAQNPPSSDPIKKLQALYEHEMAPGKYTKSAPENSLSKPLINNASAMSLRSKDADPLEELRALEAEGSEGKKNVDDAE